MTGRLPCVTLYIFNQQLTPENIEEVNRIKATLCAKGLPEHFIQMQYLGDDRDLARQIVHDCGGVETWPLIFVDGKPIGTEEDLDYWLLDQPDFKVPIKKDTLSSTTLQFYPVTDTAISPGVSSLIEDIKRKIEELQDQFRNAVANGLVLEAEELRKSISENTKAIEKLLSPNSPSLSNSNVSDNNEDAEVAGSVFEQYDLDEIGEMADSLLYSDGPADEYEDLEIGSMEDESESDEEAEQSEKKLEQSDASSPHVSDSTLEQSNTINILQKLEGDDSGAQSPSLGYIGQSLEGIERGVVGISGYWKSAMNYVGLSPTEEGLLEKYKAQVPNNTDNANLEAEFSVIQTNWYYRQQTRMLKFYHDCFVRVNPLTEGLRSLHNYTDIVKITRFGSTVFTLDFKDKQQEYYQSAQTAKIIEFILTKLPDVEIEQRP